MYPCPGMACGKSLNPPAQSIRRRTCSHGPLSVPSVARVDTRSWTDLSLWTAVPGYSASYSYSLLLVALHSPESLLLLVLPMVVELLARAKELEEDPWRSDRKRMEDGLERLAKWEDDDGATSNREDDAAANGVTKDRAEDGSWDAVARVVANRLRRIAFTDA